MAIASDMAPVSARGTFGTDPDGVERNLLRKAAETTLTAGFDHFFVVSASDRSRALQARGGYAGLGFAGAPSGEIALPLVRPGETLLIRLLCGAEGPPGRAG